MHGRKAWFEFHGPSPDLAAIPNNEDNDSKVDTGHNNNNNNNNVSNVVVVDDDNVAEVVEVVVGDYRGKPRKKKPAALRTQRSHDVFGALQQKQEQKQEQKQKQKQDLRAEEAILRTPRHPIVIDAWELLRRSLVYFRGRPVGTIAASDPTKDSLNYNQVKRKQKQNKQCCPLFSLTSDR
jgi:hypothetical protein